MTCRKRYPLPLTALVFAVATLGLAPTAQALPTYEGDLSFPAIESATDTGEYSWQVDLSEEQRLEPFTSQAAKVVYESGHTAFVIVAELAHDADGTNVPTTLAVTPPDVVTLKVHHRPADPFAFGAPFDYPITNGEGWEGGLQPPQIVTGPPDESQLRKPPPSPSGGDASSTPVAPRRLPTTSEVERLVRRADHATAVDCRRLESRRRGVGRWRCDVNRERGGGRLMLWAWLTQGRTRVAIGTHASGVPNISMTDYPWG